MNLLRSLFDRDEPARQRAWRAVLLLALLVACAVRLAVVLVYNPMDHVWSDPARHWTLGTRPLDVQPFAAIDPVGYQMFLGVIGKLTIGSPLLVAYWVGLLSLAGPWLWYRFLRELLPGRNAALAGWVLLAAMPSWLFIYSYFMQETLMLPLLGAALWATWRARRRRDVGAYVLAVAVWLAAGLTRGICLPMGFVAMAWLWFEQDRKIAKLLLSTALLALIAVPLGGRSWSLARMVSPHGIGQLNMLYQRSGSATIEFHFSRLGGKQAWVNGFASPAIGDKPFEPLSDWKTARQGNSVFVIDLDHGTRDWQAAAATLPPWTWSRWVWLTSDNLAQLFFGNSWPDTNQERLVGRIHHVSRWLWAPLALAVLGGTLWRWRSRRERLLPALMLTWLLFQGLMPLAVNEGRYRKPVEGLLVVQALMLVVGSRRDRP